MILDVSVTEYRHAVTGREVGLTRDRRTESRLRQTYAPAWFTNPRRWQWQADLDAAPGFQDYVDKYSEVTTKDPWDDIALFFQRASAFGQTQFSSAALLYPAKTPELNIAAMASASEALAGWFCEDHYGWDLYARPSKVTPDIVFRDNANRRLALVEVKSSGRLGNPQSKLTTDMIKLLKILAPTKLLHPHKYYVGLIMVQVSGAYSVNLTSLRLDEV